MQRLVYYLYPILIPVKLAYKTQNETVEFEKSDISLPAFLLRPLL